MGMADDGTRQKSPHDAMSTYKTSASQQQEAAGVQNTTATTSFDATNA